MSFFRAVRAVLQEDFNEARRCVVLYTARVKSIFGKGETQAAKDSFL